MQKLKGIKITIYLKDPEVLARLAERENKSEYIERSILYYIRNEDALTDLSIDIREIKKLLSNN